MTDVSGPTNNSDKINSAEILAALGWLRHPTNSTRRGPATGHGGGTDTAVTLCRFN